MHMPWQLGTQDDATTTFLPVADAQGLDALLSGAEPAALLIHDPWCPISEQAYGQAKRVGGPVHLVLSDAGRHLTRHIEAATGVRHESPQAMVLANGRVHWHASHFAVTRDAIRDALAAAHTAGA